jgi:3-hydroxyacyl-CoA dehydrogenase
MQVQRVGVVGCGLMGHGIVQVAADEGGMAVVAVEADAAALERGLGRIEQSLARLAQKAVEKGTLSEAQGKARVAAARGRITPTQRLEDLAACDLVIEAIVEDLGSKRELLGRLASICKPDAVFASNTSSYSIGELATAGRRPGRTVGLHFFNPVQLMKLVEVVRTDATEPGVFAAATAFAKACGKVPVACRDTPGFIVNRLLVPYMVQALLMLERGDASKEDIDLAMQHGCGHPMGPITLADYVGLDTTLAILEGWSRRYPDEPAFVVPRSLVEKVKAGKLGRKTGEGFFRWEGDKRA